MVSSQVIAIATQIQAGKNLDSKFSFYFDDMYILVARQVILSNLLYLKDNIKNFKIIELTISNSMNELATA